MKVPLTRPTPVSSKQNEKEVDEAGNRDEDEDEDDDDELKMADHGEL